MKYLKQLAIIGAVSFAGEFLSTILPMPVPGSVYGMLLMLLCLCLKIIRLEQIEETADYLLLVMPLFFVPPGISIIDTYPLVKDSILLLVLISFITALLTMAVTGHVTQFLLRHGREKRRERIMNELLKDSAYFGFALTLIAYWIGIEVAKRVKISLCNPLLIATVLIVVFLLIFDIDVETYNKGADYLQHYLTPVTVCLAVPLYRKLRVLKDNLWAILAGVLSGCITSAVSILALCKLSGLDEILYRSLLPKSITTAMALGVAEKLEALPSITVIAITVAGFTGAILAPVMLKLFHIKEPVAQGLAIGTCSHALGTSKAVEIGEIQGAMSGLAIVVAGVITVVLAPIMANAW